MVWIKLEYGTGKSYYAQYPFKDANAPNYKNYTNIPGFWSVGHCFYIETHAAQRIVVMGSHYMLETALQGVVKLPFIRSNESTGCGKSN